MTDIKHDRLPGLLACLCACTSSRGRPGLIGQFGPVSRPAATKYNRDGSGNATHVATLLNVLGRESMP